MTWLKLLLEVASEAWTAWRSRKPDEPVASQRDIAIGVASGEAARREGKIAADMVNSPRPTAYETHANDPNRKTLGQQMAEDYPFDAEAWAKATAESEDTWPGERK